MHHAYLRLVRGVENCLLILLLQFVSFYINTYSEQEHMLPLTSCQQTCMTYTIDVCTVKKLMMDRGTV
jgi:hypothetical protein